MKINRHIILLGICIFQAIGFSTARAVTTTAVGNGNWNVAGNWDNGMPLTGYSVVIPSVRIITNTSSTADLSSLVVDGTLVFRGWDSVVTAAVVTVGGTITHLANTDTNGVIGDYESWTPDNRIYISCSELTVLSTGGIDADAKGYSGAISGVMLDGCGPGGGTYYSSRGGGGGYGGAGGRAANLLAIGGSPYGWANAPADPGSGGGNHGAGGNGGGVVKIAADNRITVDGTITVNGGDASQSGGAGSGGGSGGSIHITCDTFAGSGGFLSADGGRGSPSIGGGGGGGRIAVIYNTVAQSNLNLSARPTVLFSANNGRGTNLGAYERAGRPGTLYFPDSGILTETLVGGKLAGIDAWSPGSLMISNGLSILPENFALTVRGDMTAVQGVKHGELEVTNPAVLRIDGDLNVKDNGILRIYTGGNYAPLDVGGNIALSATGSLYVHAWMTNAAVTNCGMLVNVEGDMTIAGGAWIYPVSHPTNGGSVLFHMQNLTIADTNSGFNANALGFMGATNAAMHGCGPGGGLSVGSRGGGGGYGGAGGRGANVGALGGSPYGSSNAPVDPGSGGGYWGNGGNGGGLVRIEVTNRVALNGVIKADGGKGADSAGEAGGGGSGGGIYVFCKRLQGTNATLSANGGTAAPSMGGGGGGGRIAVWRMFGDTNGISASANGALSGYEPGEDGTVVFNWWFAPKGSLLRTW